MKKPRTNTPGCLLASRGVSFLPQYFKRMTAGRNRPWFERVQSNMDDDEQHAVRAEGFDPDDPHVISALRQVKATLRAYRHLLDGYPWLHIASELYLPAPPPPVFDIEHAFE